MERLKLLFFESKPGSLGVGLNLEVSKKEERDLESAGESELSVIISEYFLQENPLVFFYILIQVDDEKRNNSEEERER